jgi:hypothetical protein
VPAIEAADAAAPLPGVGRHLFISIGTTESLAP